MARKNTNTTTAQTTRGTFRMSAKAREGLRHPDEVFTIRGEIDLEEVETQFGIRIRVSYWNRPDLEAYDLLIPPADFAALEAKCGGEIDLDRKWEVSRLIKRDKDGKPVTWVNKDGKTCQSYDYAIRPLS